MMLGTLCLYSQLHQLPSFLLPLSGTRLLGSHTLRHIRSSSQAVAPQLRHLFLQFSRFTSPRGISVGFSFDGFLLVCTSLTTLRLENVTPRDQIYVLFLLPSSLTVLYAWLVMEVLYLNLELEEVLGATLEC